MSLISANPDPMPALDFLRCAIARRTLAVLLLVAACELPAQQQSFAPLMREAFDAHAAMSMAGAQVPDEVNSFYFFLLDTPTTVDADAQEMADKMRVAARDQEYLGIAGPDPQRNLETVLGALRGHPKRSLRGLIVIYLGPRDHRSLVAEPVTATGAELRFVEFPPHSSI